MAFIDGLYEASQVMVLVEQIQNCHSAAEAIRIITKIADDAFTEGVEEATSQEVKDE